MKQLSEATAALRAIVIYLTAAMRATVIHLTAALRAIVIHLTAALRAIVIYLTKRTEIKFKEVASQYAKENYLLSD